MPSVCANIDRCGALSSVRCLHRTPAPWVDNRIYASCGSFGDYCPAAADSGPSQKSCCPLGATSITFVWYSKSAGTLGSNRASNLKINKYTYDRALDVDGPSEEQRCIHTRLITTVSKYHTSALVVQSTAPPFSLDAYFTVLGLRVAGIFMAVSIR